MFFERTPLVQMKPAFIDVETSGLNPYVHEIIEIAIITEEEEWCVKVQPTLHRYESEALSVNGFTKEKWKDAKPFHEHALAIAQRLSKVFTVGHNGPGFDIPFIKRELARCRGYHEESGSRVTHVHLDTQSKAFEKLVPKGLKRLRLADVARFLEIEFDEGDLHGALADTRLCKKVYEKMTRNQQMELF